MDLITAILCAAAGIVAGLCIACHRLPGNMLNNLQTVLRTGGKGEEQ